MPFGRKGPAYEQDSDVDFATEYEPSGYAQQETSSSLLELTSRWAAMVRSALLLLTSLFCAAVAVAGCALLCYLLLTRAFTPETSVVAQDLHLDFLSKAMTADTLFLPSRAAPDDGMDLQPPADSRFLRPGEVVDVWLELQLPGSHAPAGMVQAVAELQSADGRTAARTSSAVRLHGRRGSLWSFLLAPYRWAGLLPDAYSLRVPLFASYREKAATPFVRLKVALNSPSPDWVPEILRASAVVHLRLGLVRRVLYLLRPGTLLGLLLGAGGAGAVLGGSAGALIFFALWVGSWAAPRRAAAPAPGSPHDDSELLDIDSPAPGSVSEDNLSELLEDVDDVPPRNRLRVRATIDHDWQDVLADPGSSASQVGGAGDLDQLHTALWNGTNTADAAKDMGPATGAAELRQRR